MTIRSGTDERCVLLAHDLGRVVCGEQLEPVVDGGNCPTDATIARATTLSLTELDPGGPPRVGGVEATIGLRRLPGLVPFERMRRRRSSAVDTLPAGRRVHEDERLCDRAANSMCWATIRPSNDRAV